LGLFLLSFPLAVKIPGRMDLDFGERGCLEVDLGVMGVGEEMGEKYEERWGDAPNNPMMEGSRWWSWGIALNKCVINLAPWAIAELATSVGALLW
jgi:hypothetical protein